MESKSLDLPIATKKGHKWWMALECRLSLCSSCLRNPGQSFTWRQAQGKLSGGLRVREMGKEETWNVLLATLGFSASLFSSFPPASSSTFGFACCFWLDPSPWNICVLGIFQGFCICIYFICKSGGSKSLLNSEPLPLPRAISKRTWFFPTHWAWPCSVK